MFIDLTLDGFRIPGIRNFVPPFGVKETDGAGLTTRAITDDMMMPFLTQRPVEINESSTTSEVEHDSTIAIENGNVKLTLGNAGYIGCRVRVIGAMQDGTGHVVYTDMNGAKQTADVTRGAEVTLMGLGDGSWSVLQSLPIPEPEPPEPVRPTVISETTTLGNVEEDTTVVLDVADMTVTLGAPSFTGCHLRIVGAMESGTSRIEFTDGEGTQQTCDITLGDEAIFVGGRSGTWFIPKCQTSVSDDTSNDGSAN